MYATFLYGNPNMKDHTPTADLPAKSVIVLGAGVRIVHTAIPANKLGAASIGGGTYIFPKATGVGTDYAAGTDAYWDATAHVATSSAASGANKQIGTFPKTTTTTADEVEVDHEYVP